MRDDIGKLSEQVVDLLQAKGNAAYKRARKQFDATTGDAVLTVINLNPYGAEQGNVWLDMPALGRDWHDHLTVLDEVTGEQYHWGQTNFVRLEPWRSVAHILALPSIPYPARTKLAYRGGT
jgi:starch synthase (maltosyl-transferring)